MKEYETTLSRWLKDLDSMVWDCIEPNAKGGMVLQEDALDAMSDAGVCMRESIEDFLEQIEAVRTLGAFKVLLQKNAHLGVQHIEWTGQTFYEDDSLIRGEHDMGLHIECSAALSAKEHKHLVHLVYMHFFHYESELLKGLKYRSDQGFDIFALDFLKRLQSSGQWAMQWEQSVLESVIKAAPSKQMRTL